MKTSSSCYALSFLQSTLTRIHVVLLAFILATCGLAKAQKDTGAIVGLVRDSSGASVAKARVTVTDVDRGTVVPAETSNAGEYSIGPLPIGRYRVRVEKQGFKTQEVGPVEVNVQDRIPINVTLVPGAVSEVVTVTSSAPQLETETSEMGQVISGQTATALPLIGRNYAQLAQLSAGVAPSEPGSRVHQSFGFSANGARALQNNFLLDGVDNNANLGDVLNESAYVIQPSVDAIAEFKVETDSYTAEFGRGNGAIMNAVIKSGTNELHGDVYEFLRNDKLDGSNAVLKASGFPREPLKQNQFGFTLGGPIRKGHTFFFGDYEGLRLREGQITNGIIPTPAMIGGDFSSQLDLTTQTGVPDCSGNPTYNGEIFNARLGSPSCGVPIAVDSSGTPTNMFPSGSIDSLAAKLAALYPAPNANINGGFNYIVDPIRRTTRNNFDIRLDNKFSDSDNFFARFSYEDQPRVIPGPFNNILDGGDFFSGNEDNAYRSLAISELHLLSPRLLNEFRFGYNRINSHRYQFNFDKDISGQIGFPGVPFTSINGGLPSITYSDGSLGIGSPTFLPSVEKQNTFVFTDNVTLVRGKHSLKTGTELRFEQFTIFQPAASRGSLSFGTEFTDNPAAPGTGGSPFASFLLGIPDGGQITSLHNIDYRRQIYSGYVEDDWKFSSHLTLNLGLRYEFFSTVKEHNNQEGTFDFASQSIIVPKGQNADLTPFLAANIPIQRNGSRGLIGRDLNNFAPRVGFAYALSNNLALRGGYGIFYGGQENGPFSNPSPGFNPPFFVTESYNMPCPLGVANPAVLDCSTPVNPLSSGFPANSLTDPNTPSLYSISPKLRTPYNQQWHLDIQRQLPGGTLFQISYVGSRGLKLFTFYNGNQAVPATDPRFVTDCTTGGNTLLTCPTAFRRPASFCDFSITPPDCSSNAAAIFDTSIATFRSDGFSNYHSLQARLEKRLSHGLSFLASYTYGHALDDASSASLGADNGGDFRDQRNPRAEYGNADFDVRHRFVLSYEYELPFGKGKPFGGNLSGAADQIIGGWQLAGIVTASTGNWFTPNDVSGNSVSTSDCGGTVAVSCVRPNRVGDPNAKPCIPGTFFNTCAFAPNSIIGTFGNAGRNIIRGPGLQTWDLSLSKNFALTETRRFEFRAEFFNIWNHVNPQFANPDTIGSDTPATDFLGSPSIAPFGVPAAALPPRRIQFALKFYF
jgi:carboxypeptidase family protein/TonB-dependent receptor-like protein